jgi:iron complex transport system ATP-binding protein
MTMHDLNQALRFADTFIFIKNGSVYIHGNHDIVTPAVIEEVYGLPVMIGTLGGVRCVIPGACNIA